MRLKYQLFCTMLLLSACLIAALYLFNSWSFNQGFRDYVQRSQNNEVENLAENLADIYSEHSGWNWLVNQQSTWRRLTQSIMGPPRQRTNNTKPAPFGITEPRRDTLPNAAPPRQKLNRRGRPSPPVLTNAEKHVLIGRLSPNREIQWTAINVNRQTVGYIAHYPKDRLPSELDEVFAEQQRHSFALASLLMILLSGAIAALFATRLVKPISKVSQTVSHIRRGDYDVRISSPRRDELGDLAKDVNHLAKTLSESQISRQKWIAEISHELRTPVAILQSEIEAIEDGIRQFDSTSLSSLHSETQRLSRLIDDLHDLSLSDLGALDYQMEIMSLELLLNERIAATAIQQRDHDIRINVNFTKNKHKLLGDKQRLGQLLDNLLQNSLNYTNPGGIVDITFSHSESELSLIWQDTPPGLTDDELSELFEPLFRAEQSRNRHYGGSGLGLSIAKKIVEAHQGTISASHSSSGGLMLTLCFPLHNAHL